MSKESNNGESSNRHGCAACKHQRRKCGEDCLLQPYFGLNRTQDFLAAQKIFGISNMNKMMKELQLQDRPRAIESLVWEASMWKQDPVDGPLGFYRQLQQENESLKNEVNRLKGLINGVGIMPNNEVDINFGGNFHTGRRNLPIVASNSLALGQDCFGHIGSFNGAISHHQEQEILNQRGNFHRSRPNFGYLAPPSIRGRDYCYQTCCNTQFGAQNNINFQYLQQMPNPTQQFQVEGQSSYANVEIKEDQALELQH